MVVSGQGNFLMVTALGIETDINRGLWCRLQVAPMVDGGDGGFDKSPGETFGSLQEITFCGLFDV